MGELVAAGASSHAFAIEDPSRWDAKRQRNRRHYAERYGELPPEHPNTALEDDDEIRTRYGRLAAALGAIRDGLAGHRPDALIVVADDQDECFTDGNYPQIAVWLGGDLLVRDGDPANPPHERRGDADLAEAILAHCVNAEIDVSALTTLPERFVPSHAIGPLLQVVDPGATIPVVPVFLNAIHVPAPTPRRCWNVGRELRRAVEAQHGARRVAVLGSGGLSHFPASFPPGHHGPGNPFPWGTIDESFDRSILAQIAAGEGAALADLSSADLLCAGDVELRSWIAVLGAVGDVAPATLVYEPIYRGMMGMAAAFWDLALS